MSLIRSSQILFVIIICDCSEYAYGASLVSIEDVSSFMLVKCGTEYCH